MVDDHDDHDGGDDYKSNAQSGGSFLDAIKVTIVLVIIIKILSTVQAN